MQRAILAGAVALLCLAAVTFFQGSDPLRFGDKGGPARAEASERAVARIGGTNIAVFTHRPRACAPAGVLFVFHGLNRRAERARDSARELGDAACLIVLAPLFDKKRFPNWRYHRAGVYRDGRITPRAEWTGPLLAGLVAWGREWSGRADAPYFLFGHSAGAQFLSRIAAYAPPAGAARIVVANASLHTAPSLEQAVPYGFDGAFGPDEAGRRLDAYLALPITIYLGQEDTRSKYLVKSAAAMRQGANRLQRGRNIFAAAQAAARERGVAFNWRLVEAKGVGHSSRGMLRAPEARRALGF